MTRIAVLLLVWLALFRTITPGLLVAGLFVAVVADRLVPSPRTPAIRWWLLPRLVVDEVAGILRATVAVAATVLDRGRVPTPTVLSVHLAGASLRELAWVAGAMTLTPGTYVLDVDPDDETLELHLLDDTRVLETTHDVVRIHRDIRRVLGGAPQTEVEVVALDDLADSHVLAEGSPS